VAAEVRRFAMADQASEGNARTSPEESPLLVAEYVSLRTEIVKRIELRQQYVTISLAIAGAFLGASVAFSSSPVALIFPLLAPFLAIGWVQNDLRVWDVAQYIRERYERPGSGLGWETRAQNEREAKRNSPWRLVVVSHGGVLVFTQALAVALGLMGARCHLRAEHYVLLGLDAVAIAVVVAVLRRATRRR
jgi:hypothetical protein